MGLVRIPANLREKFTIEEREHAVSILKYDFPSEWKDILDLLDHFWLTKTMVITQQSEIVQVAVKERVFVVPFDLDSHPVFEVVDLVRRAGDFDPIYHELCVKATLGPAPLPKERINRGRD